MTEIYIDGAEIRSDKRTKKFIIKKLKSGLIRAVSFHSTSDKSASLNDDTFSSLVPHLAASKGLEELDLRGNNITVLGIEMLLQELEEYPDYKLKLITIGECDSLNPILGKLIEYCQKIGINLVT